MANLPRYVIVGAGSRAGMYFKALTETHADVGQPAGPPTTSTGPARS